MNGVAVQVGSIGRLKCHELIVNALLEADQPEELLHQDRDVRLPSARRAVQEVSQRLGAVWPQGVFRLDEFELHLDPVRDELQEPELLVVDFAPGLFQPVFDHVQGDPLPLLGPCSRTRCNKTMETYAEACSQCNSR